ncbi:MAG TPA: hypothetical protein VGI03_06955 [Verrucomicrobiae bacterium]|jgi:sugar lactone lactonase YvrE
MRANKIFYTLIVSLFLGFNTIFAQSLTVTNLAGQFGVSGAQNGVGVNAQLLGYPGNIAADASGNIYVLDGHRVRKISPDGTVTNFAGQVYGGDFDAPNQDAMFNFITLENGGITDNSDIAVDKNGNIYIAETGNFDIRKISNGSVTTLAGSGYPGHTDGTNLQAQFTEPHAIAVDDQGNVYVGDDDLYPAGPRIRKITPAGVVTTIAGSGEYGYNNGKGTNAQFAVASGLAVDHNGNIFVADGWGVRKISPFGLVTTVAGSPETWDEEDTFGIYATFAGYAYKIAVDDTGGIYVSDSDTIRYIANDGYADVSTVAGVWNDFATTSNEGVGPDARFGNAFGLAIDPARNVYISDAGEDTISKGVPPALAPFTNTIVSYDTGGTPVRSSNPWQFYTSYSYLVAGLKLRVQSTTTTNIESSWTDLPGNPYMKINLEGWFLNTTDVPLGTRYFRVVASAPGYFDSISPAVGPETILNGFAPMGKFLPQTTAPYTTGKLWTFNITEPTAAAGMSLVVQYSGDGLFWTNLPSGTMANHAGTWTLTTTNMPLGSYWLQVLATAPTYQNLSSASAGSYNVGPPLPPVIQNNLSGSVALDTLIPTNADWVASPALNQVASLFVTNVNATLTSALTMLGKEVLSITNGQTITIPGLNVGPGSGLLLKGVVTGDIANVLTNNLTSGEVSGLEQLATTGGSIRFDDGTFQVVSAGASNSISLLQVAIVAANLVSTSPSEAFSRPLAIHIPAGGKIKPLDESPASFIGQMTINGNYNQFAGNLSIAIAGTNTLAGGAQEYDQLVVNGTATLAGGTIQFGFFNPDDESDQSNVFQPDEGDIFDIVVASNIVVGAVQIEGPVWGDGRSFSASVVTRDDGLQALRLTAIDVAPTLFTQLSGGKVSVLYPTNFTGYVLQAAASPTSTNWINISTGTNVVNQSLTNSAQFYRLISQ